jgi:uncharacterized membrane protein YjjP (DUF1212 family)
MKNSNDQAGSLNAARPVKPCKSSDLLDFMLLYSKQYLGSGGPTSRLEESIHQIGVKHGRITEVFATPTGVFVSLQDEARREDPKTSLVRLRDTGTDLGRLCKLEHVYTDVMEGKISLRAGLETIKNPVISRPLYTTWQSGLAALFSGFAISFNSYQRFTAAIVSGLITLVVWLSATFYLKRRLNNPLFTDFIGAFMTLVMAALAHGYIAPLSLEAYALGGIVLLVPGLALTTAISEVAEQNLVSGTAKLMQATMALLALGLAYLIFQQLAFSLELRNALAPVATPKQDFWIAAATILTTVATFGVIFKVPPRALVWSTITGAAGWLCLQALTSTRAAAAGPFLASVMVGTVSLAFGRVFRQPSQVYSVPGIVAMLPGMLALNSFRYFASGDQDSGIAFSFKVAITAVSIVFGLMTARLPFQVGGEYSAYMRQGIQRALRYDYRLRLSRAEVKREKPKE